MRRTEKLRLIDRSRKGDVEAFEELIRDYEDYIAYIAFSTLRNESDAEDAIQNASISMFQNIQSLRDVHAFNTWMYRTVYNSCLMVARKRNTTPDAIDHIDDELLWETKTDYLPDEVAEMEDDKRRIYYCIKALPRKYRTPVLLHYYAELPYKDIANLLDATVQDVSNWMHRAKNKMRISLCTSDGINGLIHAQNGSREHGRYRAEGGAEEMDDDEEAGSVNGGRKAKNTVSNPLIASVMGVVLIASLMSSTHRLALCTEGVHDQVAREEVKEFDID